MEAASGDDGGVSTPQPCQEQEEEPPAFGEPSHSAHKRQQHQQYPVAAFEERFQQFYLQLADGKTGGMVVSNSKQ